MNEYIILDIETTGLRAWFRDRVTCICCRDSDGIEFKEVGENESEIISKFFEWMIERKDYLLVTANGKDFDLPFLCTRAIQNGIYMTKFLFIRDMKQFDIFDIPKFGRVSLNNFAAILNVGEKTGNGFEAINLFKNKEFDKLKEYCFNDVLLTQRVYCKMMDLGISNDKT
jgi:DNA polymerase elongation subunit (family B)